MEDSIYTVAVKDEKEFNVLLNGHMFGAVFFVGSNCPACDEYKPNIKEATHLLYKVIKNGELFEPEDFVALVVNVEMCSSIAKRYNITTIPTTLALVDSEVLSEKAQVFSAQDLVQYLCTVWNILD